MKRKVNLRIIQTFWGLILIMTMGLSACVVQSPVLPNPTKTEISVPKKDEGASPEVEKLDLTPTETEVQAYPESEVYATPEQPVQEPYPYPVGEVAEPEPYPIEPTEAIQPTPRSGLEATDPTTVQLASGQLQLFEFFAFW